MTPDDFALALVQHLASVAAALWLLVAVQAIRLCVDLARILVDLRVARRAIAP